MKKFAAQMAGCFLIGVALMAGIRLVEWIIPKPAATTFVCIVDGINETECKTIEEIKDSHGVML